jgi:hypothetical protein
MGVVDEAQYLRRVRPAGEFAFGQFMKKRIVPDQRFYAHLHTSMKRQSLTLLSRPKAALGIFTGSGKAPMLIAVVHLFCRPIPPVA